MGILRLIKRFPMGSLILLVFLATFATGMFARAAHAQGYGCGWDAYSGRRICGQVQPTCEQQPRPGCPNWGYGYGGNYYQAPQRQKVCWTEWQWNRQVRRCEWQ